MKLSDFHREILTAYDVFDDNDISTERLFALVCDTVGGDCDVGHIIDALIADGRAVANK
jgi:hypothetical protein